MSGRSFRISRLAVKDLNDIWEYTFYKWSKEQADRYYVLLIDEIHFISDNHFAGKVIEFSAQHYHVSTVKSHLIFYKIADDKKVEVVRILHQKMDIKKRMK